MWIRYFFLMCAFLMTRALSAAETHPSISTSTLPEPFSLHTLISMIGSLVLIVVILLAVKHLLLRQRGGLKLPFQAKHLTIIQTLPISMRDKIIIVEIEDNWMVIGITAQGMNTLYTMPKPQRTATPTTSESTTSFARHFKSILERKKTGPSEPTP